MPPTRVVVVGAGLAGAQAVAALRAQGFSGTITLLGAEGVEPYDRPPLSKQLLSREEPAWLRDEMGLDLTGADARWSEPATGLVLGEDGVVVTTGAGTIEADAAVLATGAAAVRPPGWDEALTLHTAQDARVLRAALRPGARLVVIGAGWIGAEVAGVAAAAGVDVTVVEAAAAPLSTALGDRVGGLTAPWYAAVGVHLVTGALVTSIEDGGVHLADGRRIPADVVLAAVGARPRSDWLHGAVPLALDGSVEVDERFRVLGADGPVSHVVAVGDLARRRSPRHGWVAGGHWDGALRGPALAVRTLLTGALLDDPDHSDPASSDPAPSDDPAPYVFSTQLGHELGMFGQPSPGDDVLLRGDPAGPVTALWFRAGTDELTAVLAVDRPRDVAAARRLFSGAVLPHLDRAAATDETRQLRDAQR